MTTSSRWLYHLVRATELGAFPHAPASLANEGFVHCSYRPAVAESARLYFPPDAALLVLQIDPRLLDTEVEEVSTPRGPMPHVFGPIPRSAVYAIVPLAALETCPDKLDDK
jgi:uncharacterized protein (DUF952 family)